MTSPTISVVVLYYEQPHEIRRLMTALRQIADQLEEILIVDDGSREHPLTEKMVLAELPGARRLIQPANRGATTAMNLGLSEATGEYVHFLACDDSVGHEFYSSARELLGRFPDAGLFSSGIMIAESDGTIIGPQNLPAPPSRNGFVTAADAVRTIYRRGSWFAGNATVFSRQKLSATGGFDEELEEFADAFACYVLAARHGACFEPREFAVKTDPLSGRNMSIYTDRQKSGRLLARARARMDSDFADLFPPAFRDRFTRRWHLNRNTIHLYDSNAKLAGTTALSTIARIRFAGSYLPFALRNLFGPASL